MKTYIFFFFIIVMIIDFQAQVTQEWIQIYNGPGNSDDAATTLALDASGNVYVTGISTGNGSGQDYATIKYNSSGVQQWVQRYNGPGNDNDDAGSLFIDRSGNIYITGSSVGSGTLNDFASIKYNSSGTVQWVQRYNGPGNDNDIGYSIRTDSSGNAYVTGISVGNGAIYDMVTLKYNSTGVQQWIRRYDGPGNGNNGAISMCVDKSGNSFVTGYSSGSGTSADITTLKYNTAGAEQWVQRYNGPGNDIDIGLTMAMDTAGNIYVAGASIGIGTGYDYTTIKYNSSGVQQWVQRYNGPGNGDDEPSKIAVDKYGNVYITGYSTSNGSGFDYATVKYSSSGVQQWVKRYNGTGNDEDIARCLTLDDSDNVYVTGYRTGIGTGTDIATIKYNSSGAVQWTQIYNGPGNSSDGGYFIVVDDLYNVYVTGSSTGSGTQMDYITIKYTQPIGIKRISENVPSEFTLDQNYPNPFNPTTKIKFAIPSGVKGETSNVKLMIYDVLGREISTLVNEKLNPGTYGVEFDGTNFPSGVYFYKLKIDDASSTAGGPLSIIKKMVLVK